MNDSAQILDDDASLGDGVSYGSQSKVAISAPAKEESAVKLHFIDAMRGIAILMVILIHTSTMGLNAVFDFTAKYGQMGVQLFFVASAYTLCSSHDRRQGESCEIAAFFIRRFFRIAPLYYLAIVVYLLLHICGQLIAHAWPLIWEPYSPYNIAANVLFLNGLSPSANNNVVPGGWSIGTEMLFYLAFPLIFSISKGLARRNPFYVLAVFIIALSFNIALQAILTARFDVKIDNNTFIYYNILNQLPVFCLGIFAFFLHTSRKSPWIIGSLGISPIGFIVFTVLALISWRMRSGFMFSIIPTLSGLSFIFLCDWLRGLNVNFAIIGKIGQVSYSMYIFHFIFAWWIIPPVRDFLSGITGANVSFVISYLMVVAMTFAVAVLSERLIESRGIEIGRAISSQRRKGSKNAPRD